MGALSEQLDVLLTDLVTIRDLVKRSPPTIQDECDCLAALTTHDIYKVLFCSVMNLQQPVGMVGA